MDDQYTPWTDEDFEALPTEPVHEVVPNLLQADADLTPKGGWELGTKVLVNLAGWMNEPVRVPLGCLYLTWRFDDDPKRLPDTEVLRDLANLLARRVSSGETVAVYCAGGLNRSGLVVDRWSLETRTRVSVRARFVRAPQRRGCEPTSASAADLAEGSRG
jgi:hypothetical protein